MNRKSSKQTRRNSRISALRFLLTFLSVTTVGLIFVFFLERSDAIIVFSRFQAFAAYLVLDAIGITAVRNGATLVVHDFALTVDSACSGLQPLVVFVACVLSWPVLASSRVVGVTLGIPLLICLNIVRIVTLGLAGALDVRVFTFLHRYGWSMVYLFALAVLWLLWLMIIRKKNDDTRSG